MKKWYPDFRFFILTPVSSVLLGTLIFGSSFSLLSPVS